MFQKYANYILIIILRKNSIIKIRYFWLYFCLNCSTTKTIPNDYNEAKYMALQLVKEKIVSAVAQNISFEQNVKITHVNTSSMLEK